jgi:hypothetical protein
VCMRRKSYISLHSLPPALQASLQSDSSLPRHAAGRCGRASMLRTLPLDASDAREEWMRASLHVLASRHARAGHAGWKGRGRGRFDGRAHVTFGLLGSSIDFARIGWARRDTRDSRSVSWQHLIGGWPPAPANVPRWRGHSGQWQHRITAVRVKNRCFCWSADSSCQERECE